MDRRRGRLVDARNGCHEALRLCVVLGHAEGQVDCLDVVAAIDVAEGDHAAGLRIFELVGAARRRLGLEVSTPDERRDRDAAIQLARESLGESKVREIEAEASSLDITEAAVAELGQVPIG